MFVSIIIKNLYKVLEIKLTNNRITIMKIAKYTLLSTFFISSMSFANSPIEEKVTLPSLLEVISFCSSDKSCTSIMPVIKEKELNYDVKYELPAISALSTDPTEDPVDD